MEKLIVSDYDGVFNTHSSQETISRNIAAASLLENYKYTFMMATGRIFASIIDEYQKYNISTDFISCANGNVLFDKNWNLIYSKPLETVHFDELKNYYFAIDDMIQKNAFSISSNEQVVECVVAFKNLDDRKTVLRDILTKPLLTYYTEKNNKLIVHLYSKLNDKVDAITEVAKISNIPHNAIFTIGNGDNDVEMIKHFNGYSIKEASLLATQHSLEQYDSFSDFVEDIANETIVLRKRR